MKSANVCTMASSSALRGCRVPSPPEGACRRSGSSAASRSIASLAAGRLEGCWCQHASTSGGSARSSSPSSSGHGCTPMAPLDPRCTHIRGRSLCLWTASTTVRGGAWAHGGSPVRASLSITPNAYMSTALRSPGDDCLSPAWSSGAMYGKLPWRLVATSDASSTRPMSPIFTCQESACPTRNTLLGLTSPWAMPSRWMQCSPPASCT
mmetsp:Transcript_16491/g.56090  ORF Transcript_16491/g.56090 Transcript_16491/m.56090 type:complete len:208 (-) Transcript_16491:275-898(-)